MKLSLSALFVVASVLHAEDTPIIDSLNDDMIATAQLASSTNQNIDYQPFILSILDTDDLKKMGPTTLGEALKLVPGVDMATNTMNNRTLIFRGSNPSAYGQSILVIDGIVVNDDLFCNYNSYLDLPIELIERIEVVRGAGSFIEGVNGYAGTINVITHARHDQLGASNGALFAWGGSDRKRGIGGWNRYKGDHWDLALDIFTQSHHQKTPITVTDGAGYNGNAYLGMEQTGFGLAYKYQNFELTGRFNDYQSGGAFGNLNLLPNPDGTLKEPSWYLQGKYTLPIQDKLNLILKTSVMENSWQSDTLPLPPGYVYHTITLNDGYWASLMIKSRRISGSASVHYDGIDGHKIIAGMESIWDKAIDMHSISTNRFTGSGIVDYSDTPYAFINASHAKRQTTNLYLSDSIMLNDALAIALTLGQMSTSDVKSDIYERAALIYQATRNDIFKVMIASGERYPSFQEMYLYSSPYGAGNDALTHEHVVSSEAQYIHKLSTDLSASLNIFHNHNSQQIVRDATGKFQNYGTTTIQGFEVELNGKITDDDTALLSYSYIDGTAKDLFGTTQDVPDAASHLIKIGYSHDFDEDWTFGGTWQYIGSKQRSSTDTRDALKPYNTLDLALSWGISRHTGWYAQAIVQDLTNAIIRYPAPPSTYPDDYPIAGRSFMIRTGWQY